MKTMLCKINRLEVEIANEPHGKRLWVGFRVVQVNEDVGLYVCHIFIGDVVVVCIPVDRGLPIFFYHTSGDTPFREALMRDGVLNRGGRLSERSEQATSR